MLCMVSLYCCLVPSAHLENGTGHRTVPMAASLLVLLASGPVRYKSVLHSCGTSVVGEGYQIMTVHTHGDFIVLPDWEIRLPSP